MSSAKTVVKLECKGNVKDLTPDHETGSYYLDEDGDLILHMDDENYVVVAVKKGHSTNDVGGIFGEDFLGGRRTMQYVKKITITVEV
jgi:hypothetical protein